MEFVRRVRNLVAGLIKRKTAWKVSLGLIAALAIVLTAAGLADNTVRLVRMDPSGEVATRTNFNFFFSADVVPKSRLGKFMTTDKVRFRPAVPGKIRWETTSRLRYYPETALCPSTSYRVEFAADLPGELKKTLAGDRRLEFTTERFRVTESEMNFIYNPQRKRGLMLQARLVFNYPVDADALQHGLSLCFTDNRQPIRFTVRLTGGGREAVINSDLLQRGSTARRVELSLVEGFACLGGEIGLKERYILTTVFQERRALAVNSISPQGEGGQNTVILHCSEPVDPEAIEEFISVRPAVKYRLSVTGETVMLSGDGFKPGRTYQIKVAKGAPALNGIPLGRDYVDDVTFPDLDPSLNFNSPGRYLSSKGQLNLGLETVNISQVEVEIAKIYANNIATYLEIGRASCRERV